MFTLQTNLPAREKQPIIRNNSNHIVQPFCRDDQPMATARSQRSEPMGDENYLIGKNQQSRTVTYEIISQPLREIQRLSTLLHLHKGKRNRKCGLINSSEENKRIITSCIRDAEH